MKKTLLFAFVLVASMLAFVSCKKDKKNDPVIDSPIVGTWMSSTADTDDFYTFTAAGKYQRVEDYYMNGRNVVAHEHIVGDGFFNLDGEFVSATIATLLVYMDGSLDGDDFADFWPAQEKMKFSVSGNELTLIHEYGTKDEWKETLTRKK